MTISQPPPFHLTERDHFVLSLTDEQFKPHDWEDLKSIIARNDLGALIRRPSDLRRYIAWTTNIKAKYGSITNFVCQERLGWQHLNNHSLAPNPNLNSISNSNPTPTSSSSTSDSKPIFAYKSPIPFADPDDYKILRNDWPYGVEPGISHLVIWLRTPIDVDEEGYITEESRALIQRFVDTTFVERLAGEGFKDAEKHVLWFKNWTGLQSVRSLEHVHVLLKDVSEKLIFEWTGELRDGERLLN